VDERVLTERLVTYDTSTAEGLHAAAGFVKGWLEARDIDVEAHRFGDLHALTAAVGPEGVPTLVFHGHLDIVPGRAEQFAPRIEGDRLYGRGAYDMKSGLAAALVAAREARDAGIAGDVVVAAVADEEHASLGVQEALRHVPADLAIVTEPTELELVLAHKGFVWTELEVTGRAAHGSRPDEGVDAILGAAPILSGLAELGRELAARPHPMLGPGSLHASTIDGGRELSTYPERCVVGIERRTLPGETAERVEGDLAAIIARCRAADPALVAEQRTTLVREPFAIDPGHELVGTVREAATAELGSAPPEVGVAYWADSAFIAAAGIPTVLFGAAGEGAHADVEWVSVSSLVSATRILVAAARRLCG
jgi:acetylornithine deacetylase